MSAESKLFSKEKKNNLETEKSENEQKGAKEYVKYYEEPLEWKVIKDTQISDTEETEVSEKATTNEALPEQSD